MQKNFSDRQMELENQLTAREKKYVISTDKALEKRRAALEKEFARREEELQAHYDKLVEDFNRTMRTARDQWEEEKNSVINAERQNLRADFEKKESLLKKHLEEQMARNREDKLKREETLAAKKNELEKKYYAELELSSSAIDKLRLELEKKFTAKFRELEEEKNRLLKKTLNS